VPPTATDGATIMHAGGRTDAQAGARGVVRSWSWTYGLVIRWLVSSSSPSARGVLALLVLCVSAPGTDTHSASAGHLACTARAHARTLTRRAYHPETASRGGGGDGETRRRRAGLRSRGHPHALRAMANRGMCYSGPRCGWGYSWPVKAAGEVPVAVRRRRRASTASTKRGRSFTRSPES
jgi:hypothetical protein